MLKEIDEICKANDIQYFVAAGCALGAIRQGRFMPWDDDVDVFITRKNWEKLKKVMEKDCPKGRKLIHLDNTPYYRNTVARYVDLTTIRIHKLLILAPEVCSVAVEFFILDPFPRDPEEQANHIRNMKVYAELLYYPSVLNKNRSKLRDDFDLELYRKYADAMGTPEEEAILSSLKAEFTKTSDEECDEYCMRWGRIPYLFPKDNMEGKRTIIFEGYEFPALRFTERSFRTGYGDDWMYLPDAPEQRSHSAIFLEDQDESARFDMPEEEKKEIFDAFKERKKLNLEKYEIEGKRDEIFAGIRAKITGERLSRLCSKTDLRKMLDEKQFDALDKLFADYYTLLKNPYFSFHNIDVPVSGEIKYAAAENLILQGKFAKALGISDDEEIQGQIEFCRKLSAAIYDEHDNGLAESVLAENEDYDYLIDYARGKMWCLCARAEETGDYAKAAAFADEAIEKFGRDGDLLCGKARLLLVAGDKDGAKALFEEGVCKTRNGFLLRIAEELCGVTKPEDDYSIRGQYAEGIGRMLKAFDGFCKECGADYQITGVKEPAETGSILALIERERAAIAMFGEDIDKLEKTVNREGTGFYLEHMENNPKADGFGIRFYDLSSCAIDLRDYETHSKHGLFMIIDEIEKQGDKADREMLAIMTDAWLGDGIGKYMKKRKKTRLKAQSISKLGSVLSGKAKKNRLAEFRRKHFGITKKEAATGGGKLRVGENVIDAADLDKTFDCYVEKCDIQVPVSLVCGKSPAKAQLRDKYVRRFRAVSEDDSFEKVIDKDVEAIIESCLDYHHKFLKKSSQVSKYAGMIEKKWREIKDAYGLQTLG